MIDGDKLRMSESPTATAVPGTESANQRIHTDALFARR